MCAGVDFFFRTAPLCSQATGNCSCKESAKGQTAGTPRLSTDVFISPTQELFMSDDAGRCLEDGWSRTAISLNGPLEQRSGRFASFHLWMGIIALAAAFFLFQVLITPTLLIVQLGLAGEGMSVLQQLGTEGILASYTRELIISNSLGQLLGLALPVVLFARLHTRRVWAFLRVRLPDGRLVGLGVLGILGLQPIVQWLVQVNRALPLPEALQAFEQTQLEMIRSVLESGMGVSFNLAMLALVPGICEELLFRGYAQRQFERWGGPASGILLSGVLFGAYHLRPTQVLPLIVLGTYLAYLTWRSGSVVPAIVVHIVHNGLAVLVARYVRSVPEYDMQALEQAPMPWYVVVGGVVIVGSILYLLHPLAAQLRGDPGD